MTLLHPDASDGTHRLPLQRRMTREFSFFAATVISANACSKNSLDSSITGRGPPFLTAPIALMGCAKNRTISWLPSFQDLVDIHSRASILINIIRRIGHQAATLHIISPTVYRRQAIFCRQLRDLFLIRSGQWASCHGESAATCLNCFFERALEFIGAAYLHRIKLQTQFSCRHLAFFPLLRWARILWIPQHRNTRKLRNGFLE